MRKLTMLLLAATAPLASLQAALTVVETLSQPIAPTDPIYIAWSPHPQHAGAAQPSATDPRAPISIEARCRVTNVIDVDSTTAAWQPCGFTKHGEDKLIDDTERPTTTANGAGSIARTGFAVGGGQAFGAQIRACWFDPNRSSAIAECSNWSAGSALAVQAQLPAAGPPTAPVGTVISLTGPPAPATSAASFELRAVTGTGPTRAGHQPLEGQTLSGMQYVFVLEKNSRYPATELSSVAFYLDGDTTPRNVDTTVLYDLLGAPWNSATLANGPHSLRAVMTFQSGATATLSANFTVRNP